METLKQLLGIGADELSALQMAARAFVLFFYSILLVRLGGIRTLGKQSAFDVLTMLMIGSILGRCVMTVNTFSGAIASTLVLVALHRLIAWITFKSKAAGKILKGQNLLLMQNGVENSTNRRWQQITDEDIMEALRQEVQLGSLDEIKEVYLERSGEISFVRKKKDESSGQQ
jgi:uncharacterized membrane protein YcaP (DUF421 family)